MRSVRPVFTLVACLSVLALACPPLLADVLSPSSGTHADSRKPVTLSGYVMSPGQTVTIQAVDQNTGKAEVIGTVPAATSGKSYTPSSGASYTLYPWTYTGVFAPKYWAPQSIAPDVAASQGQLEIFALAGGSALGTFSPAALKSMQRASPLSPDPPNALERYADGNSTLLFDQHGVGFDPVTPWVNVQGMTSTPPPGSGGFLQVAWSVGSYTVEDGKKIYALICSPAQGGPYPVAIYNHGGFFGLHGLVTAAGWTPAGVAGDLGQCFDWAKRGWVFAMSSYRAEPIAIGSNDSAFSPGTWTSDGNLELCLGEVTDVLALTDLLVHHASSITVGSPSNPHHINVNGKLFMYGWSHGGCITYRAVEQGAPVDAFAVVEGFTDFSLNYLNVLGQPNFSSPHKPSADYAAQMSAACVPTACPQGSSSYYYPDASGVMGYNWRSAHYFASRGDLSIQKFKTMPIMIFHGDIDVNPDNLNGPANVLDYNPVYLDEAVEIAKDIQAAMIFVGPTPPTRLACIVNAGAPILRADHTFLFEPLTCPVSFSLMDAGDSCVTGNQQTLRDKTCDALPLPLKPQLPGGEQPLHYLVVYHNMNHTNGGRAIEKTFDNFVKQNFGKTSGCNGIDNGINTVCNGN